MKVGDLVIYRGKIVEYRGMIGVIMAKHPKKRLIKVLMPARSDKSVQLSPRHVEVISESR